MNSKTIPHHLLEKGQRFFFEIAESEKKTQMLKSHFQEFLFRTGISLRQLNINKQMREKKIR
jgi:hypothetical protein